MRKIKSAKMVRDVLEKFRTREREGKRFTRQELKLLDELRSTVPHHGARMEYFDRTIGKKLQVKGKDGKTHLGSSLFKAIEAGYEKDGKITLAKELQAGPFHLALQLSLTEFSGSKARRGLGKKFRELTIRRAMQQLFKKGKISFEGETKVDLTVKARGNLIRSLGIRGSQEFIKIIEKNLRQETGWVRYYIRSKIDPATVWGKW